jgi:hypothetical protein
VSRPGGILVAKADLKSKAWEISMVPAFYKIQIQNPEHLDSPLSLFVHENDKLSDQNFSDSLQNPTWLCCD